MAFLYKPAPPEGVKIVGAFEQGKFVLANLFRLRDVAIEEIPGR